jgi:diguanylate cyclase (GGDEF)-like protein
VNDFKSINDTWGHGVGDEVLIEIARRLKVAARETDVVSRFGGDEFVVLIADVHEVDAVFVSERFKRELTSAPVSTSLGPVKVGVSLGLSSVYSADDLERAMLRADSFMYQDKRGTGSWHAVDPDTISIAMEESEILKD